MTRPLWAAGTGVRAGRKGSRRVPKALTAKILRRLENEKGCNNHGTSQVSRQLLSQQAKRELSSGGSLVSVLYPQMSPFNHCLFRTIELDTGK